jgi:phosphate transport system substrate-binding protein
MNQGAIPLRSNRHRRLLAAVAAIAGLSLIAAACGDDDDTDTTTTEAPADGTATTTGDGGGSLSGSVNISGSSTVEPISAAVAARFGDEQPDVAVSVEGPGTGDGFAKFCAGETDISDASRPIKGDEVETCEAEGIEFIELKVAIDGLSVITSAENTDLECLSFVDLYALLGPDATGVNNWSDAQAKAEEYAATVTDMGALNTPYPDASLTVTAPGEESGTFDSFVEIVIAAVGEELGVEDATVRPDYTASPNDNVIVEGISANPTSLGWVGFAFVEENLDKIKPLNVDGGDGCVEPTTDSIASGEYPIARDLYIYVNTEKLESNPAVAAYVDFYLTQLADGGVVGTDTDAGQVPYVPLAAEDLTATQGVWEAKEVGTRDGGS